MNGIAQFYSVFVLDGRNSKNTDSEFRVGSSQGCKIGFYKPRFLRFLKT